jgi:stage II sporulation SpoAA-like protein
MRALDLSNDLIERGGRRHAGGSHRRLRTAPAGVLLDGFGGWERHRDWGDVTFAMGAGRNIEKMAIVGDEKWRDEALAFTAAGFRPTAIEFFAASQLADAKRWLAT